MPDAPSELADTQILPFFFGFADSKLGLFVVDNWQISRRLAATSVVRFTRRHLDCIEPYGRCAVGPSFKKGGLDGILDFLITTWVTC